MSPFSLNKSLAQKELDLLFHKLKGHEPDSDEYKQTLDRIVTLQKLNFETKRKPLSVDTTFNVAANLFGILMILTYEQYSPLTSKAMGILIRAR